MTAQLSATAKVHWLDFDQGGRKALPSGSTYAATGRFADQEEMFSVVLRFPTKKPSQTQLPAGSLGLLLSEHTESKQVPGVLDEAELSFLVPELVTKKLAPGVKLLVTEGPRIVAECEIQSVTHC